jgi:hypothetical protein
MNSAAYVNMQFITDFLIIKLFPLIHKYSVPSEKGKLWTILGESHGERGNSNTLVKNISASHTTSHNNVTISIISSVHCGL